MKSSKLQAEDESNEKIERNRRGIVMAVNKGLNTRPVEGHGYEGGVVYRVNADYLAEYSHEGGESQYGLMAKLSKALTTEVGGLCSTKWNWTMKRVWKWRMHKC